MKIASIFLVHSLHSVCFFFFFTNTHTSPSRQTSAPLRLVGTLMFISVTVLSSGGSGLLINVKAISLLPVKLMVKARVTVQEHVESQNRERERV